jgi:hypothetical protein
MGSRFLPVVRPRPVIEQGGEGQSPFEQIRVDAGGWRAGADVSGSFGSVAGAFFTSGPTAAAPFGLAFDLGSPVVQAAAMTGAEASFLLSVPATRGRIWLDGWYSRFSDAEDRPYTPADQGRVAILFRDTYYEGQLEPSLRVEAVRRGVMSVPAEPGAGFDHRAPAIQPINLALQIRVIDVRLFLLWDNLRGERTIVDFPGDPPAIPRIVYGASWRFRN